MNVVPKSLAVACRGAGGLRVREGCSAIGWGGRGHLGFAVEEQGAGMPLSSVLSEERSKRSEAVLVTKTMQVASGRLQKRVRLSVPVVISNPEDPSDVERTTTENVCPMGARLVTKHARGVNDRVMIRSLADDQRRLARVVYCQRLRNGRFGLGVEFETMLSNEPRQHGR